MNVATTASDTQSAKRIEGKGLCLRPLRPSDATERYCRWLNDPEVSRYLEVRFTPQTLETVREYVESVSQNPDYRMFAIVDKATEQHIGNIKIGPINHRHKFAEVGIVIGEKSFWGRGCATEAIRLATQYGFEHLGLRRMEAGVYGHNAGSVKAFVKAGYRQDAVVPDRWCLDDGSTTSDVRLSCSRK